LWAVILLLGAAGFGSAQNTGYWQYVKTDSGVQSYTVIDPTTGSPDTPSGVAGNFTDMYSDFGITDSFGITFFWSPPPPILIPGTALYWPVTAKIVANAANNPLSLGFSWSAAQYPYQAASNLATFECCAGRSGGYSNLIDMASDEGLGNWNALGTVVSWNNALTKPPGLIDGGSGADSNGLMAIVMQIGSHSDYLWSYVYQWVPTSIGSCGGTCTLASSGQSIAATGGSGSVGVTATSTWDVVAADSWIKVTSAASGTGDSTVTFTVDANNGGSRSGTLIIGGQQYTVYQTGSATSGGSTSISITNPGFETLPANPQWIDCSGNGGAGSGGAGCRDTGDGNVPGWTAAGSFIGLFQPGPNYFTLPLPAAEGTTLAQVNSGTLSQTLTATLQTSTLYTLQVDIGQRLDKLYPSPPPTAQLFAGTKLIASATGSQPPVGGWTTWTGTYTSSASDPLAGQTLKIVLGTTTPQGDFDNVRLTAAPAGSGTPPAISAGGVVNAASYAPGGSSDVGLAQGSFFSVYGAGVGPDTPAAATSYPLPISLGGVTVQVTQGSITYNAYLVFASKGQINAILPSDVPVGSAQMTITYNGQTSQPAAITVAKTDFGVFFQSVNGVDLAIAQNVNSATDYPLNLPGNPAKPGQIVIFWGTGMGPISVVDNIAPGVTGDMTDVPVTITVGGIAAERLYAGRQSQTAAVDNIYFTVPAGVPFGCQVPVAITAGGVAANTTMIAITADGTACK
jgi:uncharacterized protein (TIGR03437 family)